MYPNVHRSTIYNNQDMETTYMSFNRRIDKDVVLYTMEYYSTTKRNYIGSFVEILMLLNCGVGEDS